MHRLRDIRDVALSPLRRALFILSILLFGWLSADGARAEMPDLEPPVRTGTAPSPDARDPNDRQAPHDAPRLGPGRLAPTPPPSGFNTFDGGWIRFYYHPSMRERVEALISESTVIRRELAERLGMPVLSQVRVDVARTPGEMATFAPANAPYPDYASGVAYSEIGLVLLTLSPVHPNDEHDVVRTFRHELAHVALFDAVAGAHVPRWFNEGLAVLASGETSVTRLQALWTATVADTLLPLDRMERSFPADEGTAAVAYAQAVDVVRYLVREREQFRFQALIERLRAGEEFPSALVGSYGITITELEREWREDVARRYTFWPVLFSGTIVWVGVLGLFVVGWRRRTRRARATLQRWEQEEAREDEVRAKTAEAQSRRVHIVLARGPAPTSSPLPTPGTSEAEIPKVQHEGQWHTLH